MAINRVFLVQLIGATVFTLLAVHSRRISSITVLRPSPQKGDKEKGSIGFIQILSMAEGKRTKLQRASLYTVFFVLCFLVRTFQGILLSWVEYFVPCTSSHFVHFAPESLATLGDGWH